MIKPAVLDLFCGFGGATNGFKAAGWECFGVDIWDECEKHYPGHFVLADVKEVSKDPEAYFPAMKFDFLWASPPCQEYSVSSQPFKRSRAKFNLQNPPDPSLWNAALEIQKKLGIPMILENVQGAQKFMGRATWHYGSYYFWGEMPALMPIPFFNGKKWSHRKGFTRINKDFQEKSFRRGEYSVDPTDGKQWRGNSPVKTFAGEYERVEGLSKQASKNKPVLESPGRGFKEFSRGETEWLPSASSARKEWSAKAAMIPLELSEWIGQCFYPRV